MVQIRKKTGLVQAFDSNKIIEAVKKSADRVNVEMTPDKNNLLIDLVLGKIKNKEIIDVKDLHNIVEICLDEVDNKVAEAYRDYRNYKKDFSAIIDRVYNKKISLESESDRSNANADSSLITTQKAICYSELNALLYDKFFLNDEEREAVSEGYIYIHDKGSRYDSVNCCIFDMHTVLENGFQMGNLNYTEPKSLSVAFSVIADITMNAASSQYGGFTIPEMDKLLAKYAELSYQKYLKDYKDIKQEDNISVDEQKADAYAYNKVKRDMEQGVQSLEVKFNSCSSSRGDYPFTSITFGLGTGRWETLFSSTCMRVRKEGQGNKVKSPVLFPKLSFFYDPDLHGEGKELEWLFDEAIDCSSKSMYPDFISLEAGYQGEIYKKYKTPISRMGCVDFKELVIYKLNNKIILESFGDMWKHISEKHTPISQTELGYSSGEYISLDDVEIWDKNGFVKCKCIIKNEPSSDWCKVTLKNGYSLTCTSDHLWTVNGKLKKTVELCIEDIIEIITLDLPVGIPDSVGGIHTGTESKIAKIERLELLQPSYDVTTETEHFYCSGIRSHNCRAQLSPWFPKGGMNPIDDTDIPQYVGRCNLGAISLHFPMIVAKAKEENKDFFEVLEYYMDLVRGIHKKTFKYLSHKKAGTNPLAFCQGGFINGYLNPDQEIGEDFLRPMTMSFGIIALNEASVLQTGKSVSEDNSFALSILKYVNEYITKYKKIDNILYASYGVPGESLCLKQIQQFRKKYGVIKNVSDHEYTTNSFHCCVRDNITPIEKQDIEYPLFHLCTGGNIQYCRYPLQYNLEAIKTLVRRAMKLGFYEGVNMQLNTCADCGEQFIDNDNCPKCGSDNIIRVERMNGYLSYSRINGKSMYSDGKLIEFSERVSM